MRRGDIFRKERDYNEEEINFNNQLNDEIYVHMPFTELTLISGGCEKGIIGAIKVNKYPLLDQNPCDPKAKTINGILCVQAFNGNLADDSCGECKLYGKKHKSPIYEYTGLVEEKEVKRKRREPQ